MNFDWILVPVIIGLSFGMGLWYKACPWIKDEIIPALEGTTGAILGAIAYFINVPWLEAGDILTALFIGFGSGLAATGLHQIYKQTLKLNADKIHEGTHGDEC